MTRAILHIGLPKTGTTSFQNSCAGAAALLAEQGICYPSDHDWTLGTSQHQGLPSRLRGGASVEREADLLLAASKGYECLLISSEDLFNFFGDAQISGTAEEFHLAMQNRFESVSYLCTIRKDREILTSSIREKLDHLGFPYNGRTWVQREVDAFYERNAKVAAMLGDKLTVIDFDTIKVGNLAANMLEAITGNRFNLPDVNAHRTQSKDIRYLLMSGVRMLLFNSTAAATPFTAEINAEYSRIFRSITVSEEIDAELTANLQKWIEAEVEYAMASKPGRDLRILYADSVARM